MKHFSLILIGIVVFLCIEYFLLKPDYEEGIILSLNLQKPIINAMITVQANQGKFYAESNDNGYFKIRVNKSRKKERSVSIRAVGFEPYQGATKHQYDLKRIIDRPNLFQGYVGYGRKGEPGFIWMEGRTTANIKEADFVFSKNGTIEASGEGGFIPLTRENSITTKAPEKGYAKKLQFAGTPWAYFRTADGHQFGILEQKSIVAGPCNYFIFYYAIQSMPDSRDVGYAIMDLEYKKNLEYRYDEDFGVEHVNFLRAKLAAMREAANKGSIKKGPFYQPYYVQTNYWNLLTGKKQKEQSLVTEECGGI